MPEITLPQGTIHYRDAGEGPPVVFLHGLLVDGELWRKVTPLLQGDARCIVPDLPLGSHRIAMNADADLTPAGVARLVGDLLAALDLEDVTLVGNDTGGAISQLVALDHGERVGRLVLTNCDCFEVFPPKEFVPMVKAARGAGRALRRRAADARGQGAAHRRWPTAGSPTRSPTRSPAPGSSRSSTTPTSAATPSPSCARSTRRRCSTPRRACRR